MKIISKKLKFLPLILLALVITSCSNDDDNTITTPTQLNIVETASATSNLSSLVAALQAADGNLVDLLSGNGPFTVLAPTNAAFTQFLNANGFDTLEDVPTDVLEQVLLNHVISADLSSTDLTNLGDGYTRTNADSPSNLKMSIYFNTANGDVRFNNVSSVTAGGADIETSNGTVHIVDAVIGLPTITTFATANPNFSALVASLAEADNSDANPMLIPTLSGAGSFTVFAPLDSAFTALLDSNDDWNTPADIDDALLNNVLTHHVIAGSIITSGDLTDGASPTMLNGQNITINLPGTGSNIADVTDAAGNTDIGVVVVDVQATNGVIHALNKVMLPSVD
ncbi:fasciclin domain-containing protein [Psychroserpens sp. Hel_I_66]|uniref:fasciclin domain-containing protein n=1 Tax=Psychroserpens sp. Hel_I_66 TaxID=1250004 RepID=UPI0006460FFF|nr:fasciclin domain-containing protein [Psychroserpens sp. Hel_I_66]